MPKLKAKSVPAQWQNAITDYADVDPRSLLPHPLNPRTHPKEQTAALSGAITELGWLAPVLVNTVTGHILDGHARVALAISRNEATVPVAHVALSDEQERLALATFDPIGALAGRDQAMLDSLLADLTTNDGGLADLLASLATPTPKLLNEDDADLTPPAEPITKPGDLWLLGDQHRLLCGDSTNAADVARLMDGHKAQMVFTDPPYGVNYEGGSGNTEKRERMANDDRDIYAELLPLLTAHSVPTAPLYLWFAGRRTKPVTDALAASAWEVRALLIWNKLSPHYGAYMAQYMQRHEPFFYAHKRGQSPPWFGPTNEVTVWDVEQPTRNDYHPTQKPVELSVRAINNSSRSGDIVLDLFGGSGSTLVAAEQTGRSAYLMEIDAAYVDVILRRWQTLTNRQAVRDDGTPFDVLREARSAA